jgi:predicted anti-sigma-YlaC factor YlaD
MTVLAGVLYGSCAETREYLSAHLEGELRGFRRFRVLGHLARCERCRAVLASLARTIDELRALGRDDADVGSVADAVVDRIRQEEA